MSLAYEAFARGGVGGMARMELCQEDVGLSLFEGGLVLEEALSEGVVMCEVKRSARVEALVEFG